ncbi:hypothetical protein BJX68DRAFT_263031 [Aspergillus pseudodeflectus]|uniref:Uncharacterized protein n=1 Tax=Aspergillus pseudodeflectus TaxID=176178 RepID=A0ABR4KYU5_9EURO
MQSDLASPAGVGNATAAQDLYGLGVRLGFYLQALAMILYLYGNEGSHGQGLKVASGSITVSILASWYSFAARQEFSPSEAIIVLLTPMTLLITAKHTLLNPRTIMGELIGLILLILTDLATCCALLWFFATLVHTLPRLGTPNVVFFFARVSLTGWFRYVALVYCIVDAVTSLRVIHRIIRLMMMTWVCYAEGRSEFREDEMQTVIKIVKWDNDENQLYFRILLWLTWVLTIVAVETTLVWNNLTPLNDLRSPGQSIPFVTGIIMLVDSLSTVARRLAPWWRRVFAVLVFLAPLVNLPTRALDIWGRFAQIWSQRRRTSRNANLANESR